MTCKYICDSCLKPLEFWYNIIGNLIIIERLFSSLCWVKANYTHVTKLSTVASSELHYNYPVESLTIHYNSPV